MNLCVDQGNSRTKIALFEGNNLLFTDHYETHDLMSIKSLFLQHDIHFSILSSVLDETQALQELMATYSNRFLFLTHHTALPIQNLYQTPETLGKDRLASVVGAFYLMPDTNLLVIDAGTAITYDFIDTEGFYHGGNISPGLEVRASALHQHTRGLPLATVSKEVDLLGVDTVSAIQAGVLYGVVFEIDGYIDELMLKYPKLSVFLTGGSAIYFENKLKNRIFANPNLVLIGLNRILQHNVK